MFATSSRKLVTIAGAVLAGGALCAVAAPGAQASTVHPDGFSVVQGCTGLTGTITYTPGLTGTLRKQSAVLTGTLTGCSGFNGAQAGTGTVTAVLSGSSKVKAVSLTGTVTINWPAAAGLNPSNGTLSVNGVNGGADTVSGQITSGAYTSAQLSSGILAVAHTGAGTKAHPIKAQQFVNTLAFNASENFG